MFGNYKDLQAGPLEKGVEMFENVRRTDSQHWFLLTVTAVAPKL